VRIAHWVNVSNKCPRLTARGFVLPANPAVSNSGATCCAKYLDPAGKDQIRNQLNFQLQFPFSDFSTHFQIKLLRYNKVIITGVLYQLTKPLPINADLLENCYYFDHC
jgi:hypothetical protein